MAELARELHIQISVETIYTTASTETEKVRVQILKKKLQLSIRINIGQPIMNKGIKRRPMKGKQKPTMVICDNILIQVYNFGSIGLGNKDDLEQNKLNQVSTSQLKSVLIVW
jgi:hypothetical protein